MTADRRGDMIRSTTTLNQPAFTAAARGRMAIAGALALVAAVCGGCADGVELNGKLFDMMGVSSASQKNSSREPKLTERAGLVVPPDTNRLPEPGSGGGEPDLNGQLNDPDHQKRVAALERARLHKLYCTGELQWKERATNRDKAAEAPHSPYGPCSVIGGMLNQ